jgi:hypothetical protein
MMMRQNASLNNPIFWLYIQCPRDWGGADKNYYVLCFSLYLWYHYLSIARTNEPFRRSPNRSETESQGTAYFPVHKHRPSVKIFSPPALVVGPEKKIFHHATKFAFGGTDYFGKKINSKPPAVRLCQTEPTKVTLLKFNFQYTGERLRISIFRVRATYGLE